MRRMMNGHRQTVPEPVIPPAPPPTPTTNEPIRELPPDLITTNAAAKLLGINRCTVFRWVTKRKLPAWKVGGRFRVRRADVLAQVQLIQGPTPEVQARWDAEKRKAETARILAAHGLG